MKSKKQKLYNDKGKRLKECGRCHQVLSYNNFFKVNKNSDEVRPYCKSCHSELHLIRQNRKKLRLILNIYQGKCSKCGLDSSILPALQFHHPNPYQKTISWRKIKGKNYNHILKKLKLEGVILLCSNCHLKKQTTILKKYDYLILQKNLFQLQPKEINNLIMKATQNIPDKLKRMHIREKIKEWVKKRFIVEQLYNAKCIGCGNTNLSALEFHHKDPDIDDKLKWEALENLDSKTILNLLIDQKCVCVCSNCHSLIHSRYFEFAKEILENFYSKSQLLRKVKTIKNLHQSIITNILNYKIKQKDINLKAPLVLEIPHTDTWKIHLLKIYYFMLKLKSDIFKAYDLRSILGISIKHIYKHINRFIERGYIEKDSTIRGIYKFTPSGYRKIKEIENNHKSISSEIKKQILNL